MKHTLLLIEDNSTIIEIIRSLSESEGLGFVSAVRGETGLLEAERRVPSLILLDLNLPDLNGIEICRRLKGNAITRDIPVIMLTGRVDETDVVLGLGLGADDYVKKPFNPKELVARIHSVLRRKSTPTSVPAPTTRCHGPLSMDRSRYEAKVDGQVVMLTHSEFELLWALMEHPGIVFSREKLLDKLNQGEAVTIDRVIDVHIAALRKKLGESGSLVVTIRGVGYKLAD